jgi:hypothetical protein
MSENEFVAYVGHPDIHDGCILEVRRKGDTVRVLIEAPSRRRFTVEFGGVQSVRANRAEGMLLYALCEMEVASPWRRFVFANWHDGEDDACLEIVARELGIVEA